ncbi:MAG: type II secretion system major pseudopilin GspG [Planctomycetota bacterium]
MKSVINNKRMCRRQHGQGVSGFTLIELMLVMVILATMAAIVLPKFTGRAKQAKITAAKTQIAQFEVALDAFEIDIGRYPTTPEGLRALVEKPATDSDGWLQPYIKRDVPKDPWDSEYVYRYPGQYNQDGYDLYSTGPDRKLGGDDDITNWSEERR